MKNYFEKNDEKLKWSTGEVKNLLSTVVCNITSQHNTSYTGVEGDYIIMDAELTRYGGVETRAEGRLYAEWLKKHQ